MADYVIVNGELYHHGVKGMRWGVRRNYARDIYRKGKKIHSKGDPADHSGFGVRTRITRLSSDAEGDKNVQTEKQPMSQKKKEIAIAVGTAAGTALAAYGVYKVSEAFKNKHFNARVDQGYKAAKSYFENFGKADTAIDMLKEATDWATEERSGGVGRIIRNTIENNSVGNKVDWKAVARRLKNG